MPDQKKLLVFDCEATWLHGDAFAVGAIVYDLNQQLIIDRFELLATEALLHCVDWVRQHVLPHLHSMPRCHSLVELREAFFEFYLRHKEECACFSDVGFPVETNFLSAIVRDDPERAFLMPYPLYDVVNYVDITISRIEQCGVQGLRHHHPLDDAIASAYCLLQSRTFQLQWGLLPQ